MAGKQQHGGSDGPLDEELYSSEVQKFSCVGIFSTSSETEGAGCCYGIRSSLQRTAPAGLRTRDDAIHSFVSASTFQTSTKEALRGLEAFHDLRAPVSAKCIDQNTVSDNSNCNNTSNLSNVRENWESIGITEVEHLQLTDSKTGSRPEPAATVASGRRTLASRQSILLADGERSSFLHLGRTEHAVILTQLDELNEVAAVDKQQQSHLPNCPSSKDVHFMMTDDYPLLTSTVSGTAWRSSATKALASSRKASSHMTAFSHRLVNKMISDGCWLWANLQDDIAARTVAFGMRTICYMPKTVSLASRTLRRMFRRGSSPEH